MNDLKNYTVQLLRSRIIDVTSFVAQRGNEWTLTKSFAGLPNETIFSGEAEMYDRIAQGLVTAFQHGGLRVAS